MAVVVVDEEVQIPKDPLEGLSNDERKRTIEMTTFASFTSASGLGIDQGSATNGEQYSPDIRCTISGKLHWFEMGRIISREVAENLNPRR